ncbi:HNH endonuclease [Alteromonas sp. CYL-A6]|uniref:HNH endonuclease n=1 Tax=Alteromonas nitratireducens TaxID=3390813 RepID=UPI0034B25755
MRRENIRNRISSSTGRLWTSEELKASIEAYVEMRDKQTAGVPFIKKEIYERLAERFDRTEKSFEFRMQNISHVLAQQGREWIKGLRPAKNVGANVTREIELLLAEVENCAPTDVASFNSQVEALRKKQPSMPPIGNKNPAKIETTATSYKRDPSVVAWVLNEAGDTCESCGCSSPFLKEDGLPYLEVHHVIRLADNGSDTVDNAVALCPNCHRALHHAVDKLERRESLYTNIPRLRRPHRAS